MITQINSKSNNNNNNEKKRRRRIYGKNIPEARFYFFIRSHFPVAAGILASVSNEKNHKSEIPSGSKNETKLYETLKTLPMNY